MVTRHVQGMSRVPPDQHVGRGKGESYSVGSWGTPGCECGMRIADCGITTQAALRLPRGHPEATLRLSGGQPVGTLKPP